MSRFDQVRLNRSGAMGFTLVELLVSMTVMAIILSLVGATLRLLTRDWERQVRRVENADMLARTFDILQRDALSLQRVVGTLPGKAWFVFSGQPASMSFIVLEPSYPAQAGAYFVNYSMRTSQGSVELIRGRAPFRQNMMGYPGATPANRVAIMSGAFQFAFSYGETLQGNLRAWHGAWPHEDRLPDMIRIQVADLDSGEPLAPPLVARVRADAEIDCVARVGANCTARSSGQLQSAAKGQTNRGTTRELKSGIARDVR